MLSRNVDATSNQRTNKTHAVAVKILVSKVHWKDVEKTSEKNFRKLGYSVVPVNVNITSNSSSLLTTKIS